VNGRSQPAVAAAVIVSAVALMAQPPADRAAAPPPAASPGRVETLRAVAALPVEIVGELREPLGYQRAPGGEQFVFDRRGHSVYGVDAAGTTSRKLVAIGGEEGRVIEPTAFDLAPNGTFVIADAPNGRERLQFFDSEGRRQSGFLLPGRAMPRITLGSLSLSGVGTLRYTGRSVLISQPETGGLMTEYGLAGTPVRTIGQLRETGHEDDRELHLALNAGIPLADPTGGFWFVYLAGPAAFARFDASGTLLFHRVMQGREIDPLVDAIPKVWPRRAVEGTEIPLVAPLVRTATVDPGGRLWVSFVVPYTYVFDGLGEKVRTVQFQAAGVVSPASLFFPAPGRLLVTPGCVEFAVP
jgi:hypothetical protein